MDDLEQRQPWIGNPLFDLTWIIGPAFFSSLFVLFFPQIFHAGSEVGPWMWLFLVVAIDVSHVYSTVFRTYFNPINRSQHARLLFYAPLLCWIVAALIHSLGPAYFWRAMAYFAVFHFIRQQYGFFAIYSQKGWNPQAGLFSKKRIDQLSIYAATLYPVIYWHLHEREFQWFIQGDFFTLHSLSFIQKIFDVLFTLIALSYFVAEARDFKTKKNFNIPKNLILLGTFLSWATGIIFTNNDLSFTFTNVVSHGVPYLALVWLSSHRDQIQILKSPSPHSTETKFYLLFFQKKMIPVYVGVLLCIAYVEEGFWDAFIWKEHLRFFPWTQSFSGFDWGALQSVIVPLLALPQMSHYLLDGYIWRISPDKSKDWSHRWLRSS